MVCSNKVTAWVSNNGAVELLHGLDDILSEAILVREGVTRVVDAAVDAATHVPEGVMSA
jgi:hypothetical protein